jgi:hypothetical protein
MAKISSGVRGEIAIGRMTDEDIYYCLQYPAIGIHLELEEFTPQPHKLLFE